MNNSYIAVFDSGVGGLHILTELAKTFKHENFIFIADEDFFPYGIKTKEQLKNRLSLITKKLNKMNVKAIVIACNTASANSHHLNQVTDIPILEIITATANYAVSKSVNKKIGVIATNATVKSGCYQEIIDKSAEGIYLGASDLVIYAENNQMDSPECISSLKNYLKKIKDSDTLILGCTHFPLLTPQIKELNPNLSLVSSVVPITKVLNELLDEKDLRCNNDNKQEINLYTTKKDGTLYLKVKRFDLTYNKVEYLDLEK